MCWIEWAGSGQCVNIYAINHFQSKTLVEVKSFIILVLKPLKQEDNEIFGVSSCETHKNEPVWINSLQSVLLCFTNNFLKKVIFCNHQLPLDNNIKMLGFGYVFLKYCLSKLRQYRRMRNVVKKLPTEKPGAMCCQIIE